MNYVQITQTQQSVSTIIRYYSNYTKNTIIIIAVFHKKSFIELAYIRTIYLRKKHIHIL